MKRRAFLASGAALAATPPAAAPADHPDRVHFLSDGLSLSPLEYSRLLARLVEENDIQADSYSLGGVIEKLESRFAAILGKEQAVFLPTGTLPTPASFSPRALGLPRAPNPRRSSPCSR